MKRDIYNDLLEWKGSQTRKPLLLQGARQTGKTYILKEFGNTEYRHTHYFNFEEDPRLVNFFQKDIKPSRIIQDLCIYAGQEIYPHEDLIIFDEIQVSNRALNALKYFQEELNNYHVAAAGSLLGVKMSSPGSFPVGKVNFLKIHPMTFFEFLDALGEGGYRSLLEHKNDFEPIEASFHEHLVDLLQVYYFIGGMPEVVKNHVLSSDQAQIRKIQKEILNSYVLDFAKHAPSSDIPKLALIWESIVRHLAKENKKFIFSALKKGARAREFENALVWLEDAGLIYRVRAVEKSVFPLAHYADRGCFKVYCLDVGLLGALANTPVNIQSFEKKIFTEYAGAFVENYVVQQLTGGGQSNLYYWRSRTGIAEVDIVCEVDNSIYPLEIKAGVNVKSKSLKSYGDQFNPPFLGRTTLLNFKQDGNFRNIPLYAIEKFRSHGCKC